MYIYIYLFVYIHLCVYIYVYICIYTWYNYICICLHIGVPTKPLPPVYFVAAQGRALPPVEEHFSFGFESANATQAELRSLIWEEMARFRPEVNAK